MQSCLFTPTLKKYKVIFLWTQKEISLFIYSSALEFSVPKAAFLRTTFPILVQAMPGTSLAAPLFSPLSFLPQQHNSPKKLASLSSAFLSYPEICTQVWDWGCSLVLWRTNCFFSQWLCFSLLMQKQRIWRRWGAWEVKAQNIRGKMLLCRHSREEDSRSHCT